jgi:hypothetical protein
MANIAAAVRISIIGDLQWEKWGLVGLFHDRNEQLLDLRDARRAAGE